jgi:hypothetical protein
MMSRGKPTSPIWPASPRLAPQEPQPFRSLPRSGFMKKRVYANRHCFCMILCHNHNISFELLFLRTEWPSDDSIRWLMMRVLTKIADTFLSWRMDWRDSNEKNYPNNWCLRAGIAPWRIQVCFVQPVCP